ncbi:hypothetical protein MKY48_08715 [Paenibacillus sp. FSL W8-0187]|uniref:hypothetical protein n=1 Tax=Paenibacillus sp. FSL W8-0187 TaxID=2921710 RepID=UPI0030D93D9C
MKTMYPAQVNSPGTELAAAIDAAQDTIQVADGSVLPDGPNLLTIGTDEAAETILYTDKTGDELTGITRGFQGTAQSWAAGTKVARYFTAYDHDAAIGNISELSTGLTAARDRLDTEQRQDVVLNAGMQILNAQRHAAFSLSGIKGRTLVNLLGRAGNMNDLSKWSPFRVLSTLESGSAKLTIDTGQLNGGIISPVFSVKAGKYYIAITDIKNGTAVGGGRFYIENLTANKFENDVYSSDGFKTAWAAYAPTADVTNCNLVLVVDGAAGQYAYYDSVRIYEISAAEYTSLDGMTREQIGLKYPYVDSVTPVRNPYAIRYGENLLPPFYEWTPIGITEGSLTEPYAANFKVSNSQSTFYYIDMKLPANTKYTFSAEHNGYLSVTDLIRETTILDNTSAQSATFTNINETTVRIYASNVYGAPINGDYYFKNPMLTLGSTPKQFKPREDSMLALQTDLFADPLTGSTADEVFEKYGQYFKLAKWKHMVLDGSHKWVYGNGTSGYKWANLLMSGQVQDSAIVTKFTGGILGRRRAENTSWDGPDYQMLRGDLLSITISNTDSGWGDNYTPTPDEIKAYFMGWRMFPWGIGYDPYNGTGPKGWGKIYCGVGPDDGNGMVGGSGVSTLPTTMNDMGYTPYQLVYQLATPTVEPIVSEGMLTFNEGDNQIEVGTGIVVREAIRLYDGEQPGYGAYYYTNHATIGGGSRWKYKPLKTLSFYRNSLADVSFDPPPSGSDPWYRIKKSLYDSSATYSVTYLMLDKSPIVPITGSYATNEKAMLQELTDTVQQNATAVSVLMNKKVDKDQSVVWIKPTLLNGWVNFGSGFSDLVYSKDSDGIVRLTGMVKSGTVGYVPAFTLPSGYRPKLKMSIPIATYDTVWKMGMIEIRPNGEVCVAFGGNTNTSLDGVEFRAEQ